MYSEKHNVSTFFPAISLMACMYKHLFMRLKHAKMTRRISAGSVNATTPSPLPGTRRQANQSRAFGNVGVAATSLLLFGSVARCQRLLSSQRAHFDESRKMRKLKYPLTASLILVATALSAAEVYHIDAWPQGLATVPCSAFVRNGPMDWSIPGTIEVSPHNSMSDLRFGGGVEARIIEDHCGPK